MVPISFFESCVAETDVRFIQIRGGDLCLVDNVRHITILVQGARVLVATVADFFRFIRGFGFVAEFSLVVVGDYGFDIAHAAIAQF